MVLLERPYPRGMLLFWRDLGPVTLYSHPKEIYGAGVQIPFCTQPVLIEPSPSAAYI